MRPRQTIAGAAVLAVLVVAVAPSQITERFAGVGVTGDVALRSSIWRGALDIFSQHPVAGAGINNFPFAYARTSGIEAPASHHPAISEVGGDELPPTAHNAYLNVAAEQGSLGLIASTWRWERSFSSTAPGAACARPPDARARRRRRYRRRGVGGRRRRRHDPVRRGGDRAVRGHRPRRSSVAARQEGVSAIT